MYIYIHIYIYIRFKTTAAECHASTARWEILKVRFQLTSVQGTRVIVKKSNYEMWVSLSITLVAKK